MIAANYATFGASSCNMIGACTRSVQGKVGTAPRARQLRISCWACCCQHSIGFKGEGIVIVEHRLSSPDLILIIQILLNLLSIVAQEKADHMSTTLLSHQQTTIMEKVHAIKLLQASTDPDNISKFCLLVSPEAQIDSAILGVRGRSLCTK